MTTEINKNYFFNDKEDYLKFKKQWGEAVRSAEAKSTLIRDSYGAHREKGWLQAVHHIIYNIVRDKPLNHGFVPITNEQKLQSFANNPDYAFDKAKYLFKHFQQDKHWDDYIMAPFGDTISKRKLKECTFPEHR